MGGAKGAEDNRRLGESTKVGKEEDGGDSKGGACEDGSAATTQNALVREVPLVYYTGQLLDHRCVFMYT